MALKLPDSAVPMGDFPVAKAVDIDFNDGENLQEKLDNGKLGSGGSSFSGSYNDLTDKPTIPTKTSDLNNDSGYITMDKVDHGYAKIIKNDDTDTDEAMIISYKNRDLFGVRIYKDDGSEHELKFSASGSSYVKNGVTVWTTSGNTSVADIPKTTITPVFPSELVVAPGGVAINYIVRNGWCSVNFAFNISSTTAFSWTDIATGLPKPANSVNITLMNEAGRMNRPIIIKINSTGSVSSSVPAEHSTVDWWRGNISYPVAE